MSNTTIMAGSALLETMWSARHKDLIDLLIPFVRYAVATQTQVNDEIHLKKITACLCKEFGLTSVC